MIKFIVLKWTNSTQALWRKLFPVEEYVPDPRPVEEIPRCGWALGAKLVDNPDKSLVIPADLKDNRISK